MTDEIGIHGLPHALTQSMKRIGLKVGRFEFDTAENDTDGVSNKTVAAHKTALVLPDNAIIVGGFIDIITAFTSGGAATTAVMALAANDIINAAILGTTTWDTIGQAPVIPKINTPESTSIKMTSAKPVTVTVGVAALTAGKLIGYLFYIAGE